MEQRAADGVPLIVVLPVEVDTVNAAQVYDRLDAVIRRGAPVVVADLAGTRFCDAAGVRCLVMARTRAAARGIQFRLVIPPGGLLRRVLVLLGVDDVLPVYSSAEEACVPLTPPARHPLSGPRSGWPGDAAPR